MMLKKTNDRLLDAAGVLKRGPSREDKTAAAVLEVVAMASSASDGEWASLMAALEQGRPKR
jgi:hypothetical protein